MKTQERHRVGLFSIGLETYWPQFPGLLDRLIAHNNQVSSQLESFGVEVVNLGMIDSTEKSFQAGHFSPV
jgi:L-arabinose isomerase